jgi:DNA-directed RNA polymerase specialized sigma24 family protein
MATCDAKGLLHRYIEPILGFAYNRTGDRPEAEDLAPEILVEILTSLTRAREIRDLDAWVWSIARCLRI